ncbi:MAG TPA: tRNA (guanosine(46)-N7)-methyltransferase TrmB [Bacteroidales bacterium]|nr:MAG: tRNA (guanosine(46)-N7)-methyltransferase TrmB [Bacteroidetes bacterium GWF2_33_38]OFY72429.1 MAG: tRNA (guanosine(46)-N7)-methyltransferase TrmB [Bacteroidetes bacterium RIFOXYA12_FULL_33_9]OFY89351.1 MAG: tRNA (guanosine(46)-N7)-methyltransferase TrmB [Bacteroidetes bacterium RIFOXYA2_FULL_33_7]HBF88126.1 tRNA (guanosine(46)-N7)-methyltransferase TrmB [Bacteroidales bacterium]
MGKGKLQRFAELSSYDKVFQPSFDELLNADFTYKGDWKNKVFKNNNPIVLELGCGKGEYAINLAQTFPEKNFLGVDIKGARMWKGAKYVSENKINNVSFLRTFIEFTPSCFEKHEIDEIWITFPDPQLKQRRAKKRLTSSVFLSKYKEFLVTNGTIHLKTDSRELYDYTMALIKHNNLPLFEHTHDLYSSTLVNEILSIRTFYETMFLNENKKITYIKFGLGKVENIEEPPEES